MGFWGDVIYDRERASARPPHPPCAENRVGTRLTASDLSPVHPVCPARRPIIMDRGGRARGGGWTWWAPGACPGGGRHDLAGGRTAMNWTRSIASPRNCGDAGIIISYETITIDTLVNEKSCKHCWLR